VLDDIVNERFSCLMEGATSIQNNVRCFGMKILLPKFGRREGNAPVIRCITTGLHFNYHIFVILDGVVLELRRNASKGERGCVLIATQEDSENVF
jgi:hypothetical protein